MIPVQEAASHGHPVRSLLSAKKTVALAVDGPLGPFHQVKPNLIRLASDMRFLIVPVSVASRPKLVLRRWDFRELPYPFAKVALSVGEPIRIPGSVGSHVSTDWASVVREALVAADDDAEVRLQQ
jgi:lysophospholipid acyltransferase (LPLAT)-like uncharacterized protein